jgi:hypothetical protein
MKASRGAPNPAPAPIWPPPQNFERFDEDAAMASPSGGAKKWAKADPNFIGCAWARFVGFHVYTYIHILI